MFKCYLLISGNSIIPGFIEIELIAFLFLVILFIFFKSRVSLVKYKRLAILTIFLFFFQTLFVFLPQSDGGNLLFAGSSTQKTLTNRQVDSLIQAHQPPVELRKNKLEQKKSHEGINPKVGYFLLFIVCLAAALFSFYLGFAFVFFALSAVPAILFFVLSAGLLATSFYFLNRLFRRQPLPPRAERNQFDRRKEWKMVGQNFLISLVLVGIFIALIFSGLLGF